VVGQLLSRGEGALSAANLAILKRMVAKVLSRVLTEAEGRYCVTDCALNLFLFFVFFSVVSPKRYTIYEKKQLPLVLETPYGRMTQILATHVFQIFLTEVLGYDQVKIRYFDNDNDVSKIFKRLASPIELQNNSR